jgi:hypothetical protein
MRHDEPARAVNVARRRAAGGAQALDQIEQRSVALRQVRRLRQPVNHLGVDVEMPAAEPGWVEVLVPDALQVGRQAGRDPGREEPISR